MIRKIVLVGALILLGEGAGTQLFVGVIICFAYSFTGALFEPLAKHTDQVLQHVTSIQLFSTLCSGLLLRNRMFERMNGIGDEKDDLLVDTALTFSTVVVFVCIFLVVVYVFKDFCCPKRKQVGKSVRSKQTNTKILPSTTGRKDSDEGFL